MFAHNRHLQKHPSFWQLADFPLTRWSAGSIAVAHLGADYTLLAMAFGAAPTVVSTPPRPTRWKECWRACRPAATYSAPRGWHRPSATQSRAPTIHPNKGYFPLVPEHLDGVDGVLFLRSV